MFERKECGRRPHSFLSRYILIIMKKVSDTEIKKFIQTVWKHYHKQGRHALAWREHTDPYSIVVSEIMLQQTQVARVETYFDTWINTFPDWKTLAGAKLSEVLKVWKGLGYNRRGKYLHDISKIITNQYDGLFPQEQKNILALPGIGSYTARAIQAFSFNEREVLVETNTRTAIIYHFFQNSNGVTDKEIEEMLRRCYIQRTKAYVNPQEWNWALFDYGSWLKKEVGNLNKKSTTYSKQSRFEGSDRQIRSGVVHLLSSGGPLPITTIYKKSGISDHKRIDEQIIKLEKEQMIIKKNNRWRIAD